MRFNEPERVPILPLVGLFASPVANVPINEMLTDANNQTRALLHVLRKHSYDGVFNVMDLTAEAEALGAKIEFPKNKFPYVSKHPISDASAVFDTRPLKISGTRLEVFVDTTRMLSSEVGNTHLVSSYVIGPFTLAGHLLGVHHLLELLMQDADLTRDIVNHCVEILSYYVDSLIDAGAHNIVILEPTASNSIISPRHFRDIVFPSIKKQIDQIHSSNSKATLHICGKTQRIIGDMCNTGADALSIDSHVNLQEAKEVAYGKSVLIGNVDTSLLLEGNRDEVAKAAKSCIEAAAAGGGFILSSGCDFPIETPEDNLIALISAAK